MGETVGNIVNLQKYSLDDGTGIRTIVFLKGCPLRCQWCHNPETWDALPQLLFSGDKCIGCKACASVCEHGAILRNGAFDRPACMGCGKCAQVCPSGAREIAGKEYTVDETLGAISSDHVFYSFSSGGVTLSGGEPLLQKEFALALTKRLKAELYDVAVETSGFGNWHDLWDLVQFTDEVFYDIKLVNDDKHRKYTGVSNGLILENARKLVAMGKKVVFRTPVIGGVNANLEDIRFLGEFLRDIGAKEACLLQYHNYAKSKYDKLGIVFHKEFFPPAPQEMNALAEFMQSNYSLCVSVQTH